jgi:hypothetical protein
VPAPQNTFDTQTGTVLNDTTPSEKHPVIMILLYITTAYLSTNRYVKLIQYFAPVYVHFAAGVQNKGQPRRKGVQIRDKSGFERLFPAHASQKTAAIHQV